MQGLRTCGLTQFGKRLCTRPCPQLNSLISGPSQMLFPLAELPFPVPPYLHMPKPVPLSVGAKGAPPSLIHPHPQDCLPHPPWRLLVAFSLFPGHMHTWFVVRIWWAWWFWIQKREPQRVNPSSTACGATSSAWCVSQFPPQEDRDDLSNCFKNQVH